MDLVNRYIKVKCVNNKTALTNKDEFDGLSVGRVYEVISENVYAYEFYDDDNSYVTYCKNRFEVVEDVKIKVIRKLKDLDGLKNDKGWELSFESTDNFKDKGYYQEWVRLDDKSDKGWFNAFYELTDKTIDLLKTGGFEFEYKPLRKLTDVYKDMRDNSLCGYKNGVYGVSLREDGFYEICDSKYILGQYIYEKEVAQKYADELNEIVGGK